ncbi:MAG: hypothetical protein JJU40_14110 [Rhodobacteraceae bacterium]|nr:hypothetical protein [Paracoccaceae bacterium]
MTKDQAQADTTDLARQTQALFALNGVSGPQFEQFFKARDQMLRDVESFARHWLERRQEATRSAAEALSQMNSADRSDPAAALKAVTDWQRGSWERMREDLQEWTALCMRCADAMATTQVEASSSDADPGDTAKAGSRATSETAQDDAGRANSRSSSRSRSAAQASPG